MHSWRTESEKNARRDYRRRLWQSTPTPKLFPFPRLAVSLIVSGAQFGSTVLRHKWNPSAPQPQVGKEVLIFGVVTVIVYMVIYALEWSWNYVVLAPMIMDGKNQTEIALLEEKLGAPSRTHKEIKNKLAALMRQEREIRESLKSASDDSEYTELIRKADEWVNETAALLNEAELPTDAEPFVQIGHVVLSSEQLDHFAHVAEWKRKDIARLALYRQTLDQIISNRRL